MSDNKYCYPDSDVLKNKFNIFNKEELLKAEENFTFLRLKEIQDKPLIGKFDFAHLKAIHKYIFQDIYDWAGEERTVEIGKGNLFCTVACIQSYAESVFNKYFSQCYAAKDNFEEFIKALAENYGDLNALHPFREGNGRTQREFARLICLTCGYDFDLSVTTHAKMLQASRLSFDERDDSLFVEIFSKAVTPYDAERAHSRNYLSILTSDDLTVNSSLDHNDYGYEEYENSPVYNELYDALAKKMDAEKLLSDIEIKLEAAKKELFENETPNLKAHNREER